MQEMTGIERIGNMVKRQPIDRIGLYEHFWGDTRKVWEEQGHIKPDEDLSDHFGFDMDTQWSFSVVADIDFEPQIIEETEETVLTRDGDGALLRTHKLHNATPEHVALRIRVYRLATAGASERETGGRAGRARAAHSGQRPA